MAVEIERKYLVTGDGWRSGAEGETMAQGYLSRDPAATVRVRLAGEKAWLTIKGRGEGISRMEHEYAIPAADAREMLGLCVSGVIDKTRYKIRHETHVWEVDVFHGVNEGLIVAEVELGDDSETPDLPPWVGTEVTSESRYFNSSLSVRPFSEWTAKERGNPGG